MRLIGTGFAVGSSGSFRSGRGSAEKVGCLGGQKDDRQDEKLRGCREEAAGRREARADGSVREGSLHPLRERRKGLGGAELERVAADVFEQSEVTKHEGT